MKKKNLKSLSLNKQKISQLHDKKGGNDPYTTDQITMSTCSCITCGVPGCNTPSVIVCPPPPTQFCTIECVTQECSFIVCPLPLPIDNEL